MPERAPPPPSLAGLSLAEIAEAVAARRLPPVEAWDPPSCGDSGMRILADGTWLHEGAPIARPAMVRLFATLLRREADGSHVLVTPVEKLAIAVEDSAFVAVEVTSEGAGPARRIAFRLNTGDPATVRQPFAWRGDTPYLAVRGGLEARIARGPYYELAELALAEGRDPPGVWSDGLFLPLVPAA